jgi:hypothetical protein
LPPRNFLIFRWVKPWDWEIEKKMTSNFGIFFRAGET